MPPWVVLVAMVVIAAGSFWYASSLDYPEYGNQNLGDNLSPADTGIGFAPFPQFPSSELPVPVVYGKARLNGLIVHTRAYGDNFEKCHYILMWGDKGYTIDQIYIDKYKLEDLPNYYENIQGAIQDTSNSWANSYPIGGEIQLSLNNSGSFGVMKTTKEPGTLVATTPAIFYGGGTIKCRSLHIWSADGSAQRWQWRITNLNNISEVYESEIFEEIFSETQTVDGGDKGSDTVVPLPGSALRDHTFEVSSALSKWSVELILHYEDIEICFDFPILGEICYDVPYGDGQTTFYDFEIVDISYTEVLKYNGTVSHVHLVKDESLTSNQPVINAEIYKTDNGNPATSLYEYLTDTAVGLGLQNVDYISASETASWCTTNDYYYNRAITAFYNDDKIVKEMCSCGRIILYEENGKVKMRPDKVELVTYLIDDTEIIPGSLKMGISTKTAPNRVEGQYTEPFYGYTVERVYAEDHEDVLNTGLRAVTLGLAGVTDQSQAWDLTNLALNYTIESKYWCSFDTGLETAAMFKIGDVIEVTSDTNALIDGKKWRVQKITEGNSFKYNIYCKQYTDAIYDFPPFSPWYEQITELEPIHGWPGPEEGAATVVNIIFADVTFATGCPLVTSVSLTWLNPTERFDTAKVYYSHNNIDWEYVGATSVGAYSFNWPMRYGMLYIKVVSIWGSVTNDSIAPIVSQYITGDSLCVGDDYPGYGIGQWGMQPWGG